jgi:hypothetical protein
MGKRGSLKGEQPVVSYVFSILLSVGAMIAITLTLIAFYDNVTDREIERQLTQITAHTANEISKLYGVSSASSAAPGNSSAVQISKIELGIPEDVSGRNYDIYVVSGGQISTVVSSITINGLNASVSTLKSGAKIVGRTRGNPHIVVETDLPNINVQFQGRIINGQNSTLRYIRYNLNGTMQDVIVAGGGDLLIQISSLEVS